MSELSKYIHKELETILKHVHRSPAKKPTKSASLQKIKQMVETAPFIQTDKKAINKSIRRI